MGNRLYVGNLAFHCTSDSLRDAFARSGEVTDAHVIEDRMTGKSRGFGFVTMGTSAEAEKAIEEMNGAQLEGRELRVSEAAERQNRGAGGGNFADRSAKRERW